MALSKIKGTVIADDAINADRIADGTVVASDLLDNTLTGAKLATDIAISTTGAVALNGTIKLDGNYPAGTENVALGDTALDSIESGSAYNVAIGSRAGTSITTGDDNIAIGVVALCVAQTNSQNIAIGSASLRNNTGATNVAVGHNSLCSNTTASNNTAVGTCSLQANTTGYGNVAVGSQSLSSSTTAVQNAGFGYASLRNNTTGNNNTAVGFCSLNANTTASNNTALGYQSLIFNTTGENNLAVGRSALQTNTTGNSNSALGYLSLFANTTGTFNVAVGDESLCSNTTGFRNSAVGTLSLSSNTTGCYNIAFGRQALSNNTTASSNTAVGYQSIFNNTTGCGNTALGYGSHLLNTTGKENTALGYLALRNNTTGCQNTAVGGGTVGGSYGALGNNTTGLCNTAVGLYALGGATTGNKNTALGRGTGSTVTTGSNLTLLGFDAEPSSATATNEITLGDANVTDLRVPGAGFYIDGGNVGIGTSSPSARVNILESTVGTDPTADSSNFIKLTNSDVDTINEVFGIGFSSLSGGTDYLGAFVQALGNYNLNFNHSLIFGTRGTSGDATERMRIDSSGNVGIGVAPSSTSAQGNTIKGLVLGGNTANGVYTGLQILNRVENSTTSNGISIDFDHKTSGATTIPLARLIALPSSSTSGNLRFYTSSGSSLSERMRIDSSGRVLAGTTSNVNGAHTFKATSDSNLVAALSAEDPTTTVGSIRGIISYASGSSGAAGTGYLYIGRTNTGDQFFVRSDGDCQNTNNSYGAISDRNLKENEVDASSQWNDIKAIQVKNYNLKSLPERTHLGVIAQDLEASGMNGLVKTDEDGTKSVKYSILYMKSVKALQEAMERIETLEAKVQTLENNQP